MYLRVSSNRQVEEGDSLDSQERSIRNWAKNHNHEIVDKFADEGISGFSGKRKSFEKMISMAVEENNQIDGIVVYNFSRFARNQITRLVAENSLENAGVKLYSVKEELPEDEDLAFLLKNIIGTVNEHQSRQNSKTVRDSLAETALKGFYTGGVTPFGYQSVVSPQLDGSKERKILILHPDESEIVKEIYNLSVGGTKGKGIGLKAIANHLNKRGLIRRNKDWETNDVHKVLINSVNYGDYQFKSSKNTKESRIIIIKFAPIITKKMFDIARSALKSRRPSNLEAKGVRSPSLLTGMLKCKSCGANLIIMTGKSGKYEYYKCRNKIKRGNCKCNSPNIPKKLIEDAVISVLSEQLLNVDRLQSEADALSKIANKATRKNKLKLLSLSKKLISVQSKIHNLWDKVSINKRLIDDFFIKHMNILKKENDYIEKEIIFLKKTTTLPFLKFGKNKVTYFIENMKKALVNKKDDELLKAYLMSVIDKIEVSSTQATIKGSKVKLMSAISQTKMGTPSGVPTLVSMWR
jgi:DNA invertase Pin-like site-specific DNA recombinase